MAAKRLRNWALGAACVVGLLCNACSGERNPLDDQERDEGPSGTAQTSPEGFVDSELALPPDLRSDESASGPLPDAPARVALMYGDGPTATVIFEEPEPATATPSGTTEGVGPEGLDSCDVSEGSSRYRIVSRATPAEELCSLLPEGLPAPSHRIPHSPVPGTGALPVPMSESFVVRSYTSRDPDTDMQRSVAIGEYPGPSSVIELLGWWYGNASQEGGLYTYEMDAYAVISEGLPSEDIPAAHLYVRADGPTVKFVRAAALTPAEEQVLLRSVEW